MNAKLNGIAEKPAEPTGTEPGAGASVSAVVAAAAAPGSVGAAAWLDTLIERKSTLASDAASSICTSSERTSSSAGTALPRRTTVV